MYRGHMKGESMHWVKYVVVFFYFCGISLYGVTCSKAVSSLPLLSKSMLYIDHSRQVSIDTIEKQNFTPITKDELWFGYSPHFTVWIKIQLCNPSNEKIHKVIEYTNPLTTHLRFYDAQSKKLLFTGGTASSSLLRSINPAFPVTLLPHEHRSYYLQASSTVTTLIVGLTLWNVDAFYQHESKHQFMLALFLGAMVIIILYNLFIYFSVREKVYLYYVLAFTGIIFHHMFYKGIGGLYFFSPEATMHIVQYASFIVATPTFFLTLFTKDMLRLEQYPRFNSLLNMYLVIFVIGTLLCYIFDLDNIRNIFSVLLLLLLFVITFYALLHHNRQAKFIMFGWVALMSSGLLMYLSSAGIYDVFQVMPYYVELSLLLETLLFSLILADRIKQLRVEKIASQHQFIAYQAEEEKRLKRQVEEKTSQLQTALREKDLLLQELNHRVKNSIQTIVSFLRLQIDETEDVKMQETLFQIENRILSISHLYSLLYAKENMSYIHAYEYFSLLIDNLQSALSNDLIEIKLYTDITLHSEEAVYCGFIINEAVTNALQHAFTEQKRGIIVVRLTKQNEHYILTIKDNGKGFDTSVTYQSLGLVIIESLASYQLHGTLDIFANLGTEIIVKWEHNHE